MEFSKALLVVAICAPHHSYRSAGEITHTALVVAVSGGIRDLRWFPRLVMQLCMTGVCLALEHERVPPPMPFISNQIRSTRS